MRLSHKVGLSGGWPALVGTLAAFLFGFWYAGHHRLEQNFHQRMMAAAVNYACTGRLASPRLPPNPTDADRAGFQQMIEFLYVRRLDYSCATFPRGTTTTFFDGVDYGNVEAPLYLSLLYGAIWRWSGIHWAATYYVIGLTTALSFLALYLCASRLAPRVLAAGLALAFLANPLFIVHALNPRDALKFPFAIATAGLLIGSTISTRRPLGYIAFSGGVGLLIGTGYGFRSDLLFFLLPSAVIIGGLGALDVGGGVGGSRLNRRLRGIQARVLAVCALISAFFAGAWMPLVNDNLIHRHAADVGYHVMVMGQLGNTDEALYQKDAPNGAMYMFRNDILSDVPAVVRVVEYAARRGAHVSFEQGGPYWTFAKRYYVEVISRIPADVIARGIGAFIHLMTFPGSFARRPPLLHGSPSTDAPWGQAYAFMSGTSLNDYVFATLDGVYRATAAVPVVLLFFANFLVFFVFLCVLTRTQDIRTAISAIVLIGAVLMVVSLKFEMRHAFYIYAFLFIAWCTVLRAGGSGLRTLLAEGILRQRPTMSDKSARGIGKWPIELSQLRKVATLVIVVLALVIAALYAARAYQVHVMRQEIADFLARKRIPAEFETVPLAAGPQDGRIIAEGRSRIRILSAVPLSTGGQRMPDAPVTDRGEMGVVALEFDGGRCPDRVVSITAFARSDPSPVRLGTIAYTLLETFVRRLNSQTTYLAFLPMYFYRHPNAGGWLTVFEGIEIETRDAPCIKSVSLVADFRAGDVLMDYFVPLDADRLEWKDLFQRVYIPGLGYL